jgi:PRC-barrel domain
MTTNKTSGQRLGSHDEWVDRDLYDIHGEKVGKVSAIYYDDASQRPEWVAVHTGLFGSNSSFVPISGAAIYRDEDGDDEHLQVQFSKDQIKDAPNVDDNGTLSPEEERRLYEHYGYDWGNRNKPLGADTDRLDKDYRYRRFDREQADWSSDRRHDEHMETVPVKATAQVEVPVEAQVRLRKYQTQQTKMVPVTETEEHVEVADVDAKAKGTKR